MSTTTALVYPLIVVFLVIERLLRKGQTALSLKPGDMDRGSSTILWMAGLLNLIVILSAPLVNRYGAGVFQTAWIGWLGIVTIVLGIGLRSWAAITLGQFYTRTLTTVEGQHIIDRGPYQWIRHPGYLATCIVDLGAGLAVTNWIILLILLLTGLTAKIYRIRAEEEMLITVFQQSYQQYVEKTWMLLPLIY